MALDFSYIRICILTLDKALELIAKYSPEEIEYNLYRSACIKEFEIIIEQSNKLLKKHLSQYSATDKSITSLNYKEVLRKAVLHGVIDLETCERWIKYRDNRNDTAHDYGSAFAEETLKLLPRFIEDVNSLLKTIETNVD